MDYIVIHTLDNTKDNTLLLCRPLTTSLSKPTSIKSIKNDDKSYDDEALFTGTATKMTINTLYSLPIGQLYVPIFNFSQNTQDMEEKKQNIVNGNSTNATNIINTTKSIEIPITKLDKITNDYILLHDSLTTTTTLSYQDSHQQVLHEKSIYYITYAEYVSYQNYLRKPTNIQKIGLKYTSETISSHSILTHDIIQRINQVEGISLQEYEDGQYRQNIQHVRQRQQRQYVEGRTQSINIIQPIQDVIEQYVSHSISLIPTYFENEVIKSNIHTRNISSSIDIGICDVYSIDSLYDYCHMNTIPLVTLKMNLYSSEIVKRVPFLEPFFSLSPLKDAKSLLYSDKIGSSSSSHSNGSGSGSGSGSSSGNRENKKSNTRIKSSDTLKQGLFLLFANSQRASSFQQQLKEILTM